MDQWQNLAKRVAELEAIEAIKKLKARWWLACDKRDIAGMRGCFDESNFLIDFGFIGQFTDMDAFIGVFEKLACHPTHFDSHHGMAPEITITGPDTAVGRWRIAFQLLETSRNMIQLMSSYYDDEYVRVDGEWKMRVSKSTLLSNLLIVAEGDNIKVTQIGGDGGMVTEQ